MWTIEWIHEDQTNHISEMLDTSPLTVEYTPIFFKHHGRVIKKRKREQEEGVTSSNTAKKPTEVKDTENVAADLVKPVIEKENEDDEVEEVEEEEPVEAKAEQPIEVKAGTADDHGNFFYLVKPRTSGKQKVLIPLSPTAYLFTCLQHQVVLEFPTVQVLSLPPSTLPAGFVLEDEYLAKFKAQQDELKRLVAAEDINIDQTKDELEQSSLKNDIPNEKDLLAILQRDIGNVRQ